MNIIYIRTSTEEQAPENQIRDCQKLCKEEYELLQDKQSAYKDNVERENFNKILKLIQKKQLKHLYVWDWDRIYRNRNKLKGFFILCKTNGCIVHSYRQVFLEEINNLKLPEGFDFIKDMVNNIFIELLGWIAEDESKKKSDRVKLAVRKSDGKVTKSYKGNKWGRKSMHTNKIKIVLELRDKGLSFREISKQCGVSIGKISQLLSVHKSTPEIGKEIPLEK